MRRVDGEGFAYFWAKEYFLMMWKKEAGGQQLEKEAEKVDTAGKVEEKVGELGSEEEDVDQELLRSRENVQRLRAQLEAAVELCEEQEGMVELRRLMAAKRKSILALKEELEKKTGEEKAKVEVEEGGSLVRCWGRSRSRY